MIDKYSAEADKAPLNIAILGLGYVGITAAACLLSQGHTVVGVDVNAGKVQQAARGISPIAEPGVPEMLQSGFDDDRLSATTEVPELSGFDCVIICVGTPSAPDGSHNLSFILEAARQVADSISSGEQSQRTEPISVIFRSTFRPGTMENVVVPLFQSKLGDSYSDYVDLVYNPEFLREGTAVSDYFNPPKIVVGSAKQSLPEAVKKLYSGVNTPHYFTTGFREAELTKFVDNTWHAVKVSFANEIGRICSAYDVDSSVVHRIFVSDSKLNISQYYLKPGGAFGGSCLPKDVRATQYIASAAGIKCELIDSVLTSNESHKQHQLMRVRRLASPPARVLIVGLAFKSGTDDLRESPNVTLAADLVSDGYEVSIYDPIVKSANIVGQNFGYLIDRIPNVSEKLLSGENIDAGDYDLVVVNNSLVADLDLALAKKIVDLRVVTGGLSGIESHG